MRLHLCFGATLHWKKIHQNPAGVDPADVARALQAEVRVALALQAEVRVALALQAEVRVALALQAEVRVALALQAEVRVALGAPSVNRTRRSTGRPSDEPLRGASTESTLYRSVYSIHVTHESKSTVCIFEAHTYGVEKHSAFFAVMCDFWRSKSNIKE